MAQKFIGLDDAAEQLGATKDQLNALREAGDLRGYRDGASWKFRTDDIEELATSGKLSGMAEDSLSLDSDGTGLSGESLELSDDMDLDLGSFQLSDDDISSAPEGDNEDADSILLTEDSVGADASRPPSTIIGKSGADIGKSDDDLQLNDGTDALTDSSSDAASKFDGLEELELDLEAESSRILEAEDLAAAQAAAKGAEDAAQPDINALESDLSLAPGSDAGDALADSPSGAVSFELAESGIDAGDDAKPGSSAVLSDDNEDDFVLGGEGSDVTLSGADSGINLLPSDSGLALDDASLDLTGAGSSLDLSESFGAEISDGSLEGSAVSAEVSGEQDFLLQPAPADMESEEDSSQIIALEEVGDNDDEVMISDEVGFGDSVAAAPVGVGAMVEEARFDALSISLLSCAVLILAVCGVMSFDMIRTMWSWQEPSSISSGILDSLGQMMGL